MASALPYLEALAGFEWSTPGKGMCLLSHALPHLRGAQPLHEMPQQARDRRSCCVVRLSGGFCSSVHAPQGLDAQQPRVDGHAVHFSRDPTCPAGNEGWDGTARGWTRGSARYRDIPGRWSLGRCKAIVAGWWTRRPTQRRPQEEEATSLMRSWWGQVICQSSYCSTSDDFKTLHGTCRSISRVWREPVPRIQGGSARWSSDQLDPVLCVGLPWINRDYCYLLKFWTDPPSDRSSRESG